jgi:hypothetical protein
MSPERMIVLKLENLDVSKMSYRSYGKASERFALKKRGGLGGQTGALSLLRGRASRPPGELGIAALRDDQCNSKEANDGGPGCKPVAQVEKSGCA